MAPAYRDAAGVYLSDIYVWRMSDTISLNFFLFWQACEKLSTQRVRVSACTPYHAIVTPYFAISYFEHASKYRNFVPRLTGKCATQKF